MRHLFVFAVFLLFFFIPGKAQEQVDSLLSLLDRTIEQREQYDRMKEKRIIQLKKQVRQPELLAEEKYRLYRALYREYESYICDSALYYVDCNLRLAEKTGNRYRINGAKLSKAHILATSGLFIESLEILHSLDKDRLDEAQLSEYFSYFSDVYLYLCEYAEKKEYSDQYAQRMFVYRDSLLAQASSHSLQYVLSKATDLARTDRYEEAERLLVGYRPYVQENTRDYSMLESTLAFIYHGGGKTDLQKSSLARSALSDIRASIKENLSLRSLAEILYDEGQTERADQYMKASMEDANFYNARLRNIQASKMLPIIDKAYRAEKEKQRKKLQIYLIAISVLSVFLLIAVVYVIVQMRKLSLARKEVLEANRQLKLLNDDLSRANERQKKTNGQLTEANHIKEEYIGRFLHMCSVYIDKLEKYRRMLNKKAAAGQVEELYKILKSNQFIEEELKEFYDNFDTTFLNIFPDFVQCFNLLLPPSEQICPKPGEKLTTELRIFALIRLGITNSAKIAAFLRYSITTIYTYRSKLRTKSLYPEDFEERVMKIDSFDL